VSPKVHKSEPGLEDRPLQRTICTAREESLLRGSFIWRFAALRRAVAVLSCQSARMPTQPKLCDVMSPH
jgi:hypothetical protein